VSMTICIGAICNWDGKEEAIVTVSDYMVSTGHYSADHIATKIDPVHPDWNAMFSADDLGRVVPVLDRVRSDLKDVPAGLDKVCNAFSRAVREELALVAQESVLAPFGLSLEEFRRTGLRDFGPSEFSRLLQRIETLSLRCEFLVCGFGERGEPHIFTLSEMGIISVLDHVGFWAIGSGQQSALSTFFFHSYNKLHGVAPAIYHACEAKFMAETATGVGELTFLAVHLPHRRSVTCLEPLVDSVRELWEAEGKPRVPKNALGMILKWLETRG